MICGDPDAGDRYVGIVARDLPAWAVAENPVCRIKAILRYPIQHAVIWAGVAHERPPLTEGGLYTLRVFRRVSAGEYAGLGYPESLEAAIRAALAECRNEEERGILERHLGGDFRGRRAVKAWKEWEL